MKTRKLNVELIWKQFEDLLVPRLRLSVVDRAVYSHLLRHSRLEGKLQLRFSIAWLARGARVSEDTARRAVRRLAIQGALHLVERTRAGHVVKVRLPEETRGARTPAHLRLPCAASLEKTDFMQTKALRQAIHARERGQCFYCMRRLTPMVRCLDHAVPRVHSGRNSYRNLVSCCLECNSQKGDRSAIDFLRRLYRERRLSDTELAARLRALDALVAGKMRPEITGTKKGPKPAWADGAIANRNPRRA